MRLIDVEMGKRKLEMLRSTERSVRMKRADCGEHPNIRALDTVGGGKKASHLRIRLLTSVRILRKVGKARSAPYNKKDG